MIKGLINIQRPVKKKTGAEQWWYFRIHTIFALQFVFGTLLFTEDSSTLHTTGDEGLKTLVVAECLGTTYIKVVVVVTSQRKGEVKKKRRRTGCFGRSGPMPLVVPNSSHGPNHPF